MKKTVSILKTVLFFLVMGISMSITAQSFVHPGILHKQSDFDRMAARVNEGVQPWKGSYDKLVASPQAQLSWTPRAKETVIRGGTGDNVSLLYNDVAAAYQHALIWKITGNTAHGDKAVEILNAWSATHTTLTGNADRYLASGLFGYQFANAAEMMRGYSGFDLNKFQGYMLNVYYYPLVERFLIGNEYGADHNDACITNYWANWDLCNMAAMVAIGVLCDNRTIYDKGIGYFKTGEGNSRGGGNGVISKAVPFVHSSTLGQWQESGRDQGHSILGIGLMASFCEIVWNQGDDMYGWDDSRFRKGAEYVASYNLGNNVPFTKYTWGSGQNCAYNEHTAVSSAGRGELRPIWEMIYNHYANRAGQGNLVPNVTAYAELMRPEGGPGGHATTFDQPGFGSLTYSLVAGSCSPTAIIPYLQVNGGSWQQTSSATVDAGSTIILGPQPFDGAWNWSTGETTREITISNIQSSADYTANYTNICGVVSSQVFNITVSGSGGGGGISNGTYKIIARHSGRALEVENDGTANGSNVRQWKSNSCLCQQWTLTNQGNDEYTIVGAGSGKNLDVSGISTADGANIQIWQATGGANQRFTFTPTENGYYRITPVHSGKALDVEGASNRNGANVYQWAYLGGDNQQWSLSSISSSPLESTLNNNPEIVLYPNPVSDMLTIDFVGSKVGKVELYNTQGILELVGYFNGDHAVIDFSEIPAGIYIAKIIDKQKVVSKRIIKE